MSLENFLEWGAMQPVIENVRTALVVVVLTGEIPLVLTGGEGAG